MSRVKPNTADTGSPRGLVISGKRVKHLKDQRVGVDDPHGLAGQVCCVDGRLASRRDLVAARRCRDRKLVRRTAVAVDSLGSTNARRRCSRGVHAGKHALTH